MLREHLSRNVVASVVKYIRSTLALTRIIEGLYRDLRRIKVAKTARDKRRYRKKRALEVKSRPIYS